MKKITFLLLLFATVSFAQPTTNPAPPTNAAADVISVYGNTFTNVVTNYDPNWGQSGHNQVNENYDPGTGISVLAYPNFNYQGTELTTQNAAGMEFLHIDIWTSANSAATDIQVSPINNGTGAGETLVSIAYTSGTWTSVDIPIASFTGMTWDSVFQMKFAANGSGSTTPVDIYLDNVYFWRAPLAPGSDATLIDLQVDGVTVAGFSPGGINYTVDLVVGTTEVPQITEATPNDPTATVTSIIQAPSIPGDATVSVTSQNGSVMETYTVSFAATVPGQSPLPGTPNAEVLSVYGDTGGFTTIWTPDYTFGAVAGRPDLDPSAGVNEAIKMDFSIVEYGEGTNTQTDVTAYNWVHFDYFADADAVKIRFILIGGGEFFYDLTPTSTPYGTLVTGSWQSIDIPLSYFTGIGWNKNNFFQYKLGSESNLNAKIVYFDNIYLSVNQGIVLSLGVDDIEAAQFSVYPNPTNSDWNLTSNSIINTVRVYDILGKQVIAVAPNSSETVIDASSLKTGMYFAKIESANGSKTVKLIRE